MDGGPRRPAKRIPTLEPLPPQGSRGRRVARRLGLGIAGVLGVGLTFLAARKIGVDKVANSVIGSDLTWVLVAPITRTVRGIPTEVPLGPDQGLAEQCVASFDNLQPIRRSFLTARLGALVDPRQAICSAIAAMADC